MIEKKMIPVPPCKGLYLDGVTVPGGLSKAENVTILQDGTFERRLYERTLTEAPVCLASNGFKNMYELLKADGTRYLFADIDNSDTAIASFGSELITGAAAISAWSAPAGSAWGTYGTNWTHADGNVTPLVANVASVIGTQYRVVTSVTCTAPLTSAGNWAYTSTDSTFDWVNWGGGIYTIWSNKWTHTAGATTALTAISDFTPVAGQTYRIVVYAVHTSGTGLSVYIGGKLAGVISSTGSHEFVATFVTNTTALRFVPSSDWVGYVEATEPQGAMAYSRSLSVRKFLDPSGANIASNWGSELITSYWRTANWYPEASASVGQSLTVSIGGVAQTAITESGVYTYDVTATTVGALTYTPTINWAGSVNTASVRAITYGAAGTKTKIIGGTVTGTTDYDVSWADILTDLTAGSTIQSSWTTLQDRAFRVDGTNINRWFSDASGYHSLGVPAPDLAPVTASTTGGEITAGTYNVFYTYVKKDAANEYYIVESNPSPQSNITITGAAITVAVVKLVDDDVTHIRIYRTLYSEMGSDAYLALEVANETATHTLIIADDLIGDGTVLTYDNDRPPTGKFVLGAGSRLWLIDTNGLLHWSKLDYPEQMPGLNQQSFDPKDGDEAMGMCALRSNLLVFKRRRTWLMNMFSQYTDGDGNAALAKDVVSSTLGCIATGSIQSAGQESAIWLSGAGIILYDGGTFRNISGGDIQTGTPSRIQSVITNFINNGAEYNITSSFHSIKQLYHINFLYRTGSVITSQRHFVYNIITDTWTEYVYRDSTTQARVYVTNIALGHDTYGNEVVLLPHLLVTNGAAVHIYQGEYSPSGSALTLETQIMTATGDGVTALSLPYYSFCDDDDNVYVLSATGVFKITSAGVKSCLATKAQILTEWSISPDASEVMYPIYAEVDLTNSCAYFLVMIIDDVTNPGTSEEYYGIFKITLAGVLSLVKSTECVCNAGYILDSFALNSDGDTMYLSYWRETGYTGTKTSQVLKIVDPGGANTETVYYTFPTYCKFYFLKMYGDNIYFVRSWSALDTYMQIGKFTDITGDAALSWIGTGLSTTNHATPWDLLVISDTEFYLPEYDSASPYTTSVQKITYDGAEWVVSAMLTTTAWATPLGIGVIRQNTAGDFIIYGFDNNTYIYNSAWELTTTIPATLATGDCGVSYYISDPENEYTFIVCGSITNNVVKTYPPGYWELITDPNLYGTVAHIVSNYEDLEIPNEKRISRAYLDVESQYAIGGTYSLEPDYNVNVVVHADLESTEPTGATQSQTFTHPGRQTWVYTDTQFDSTVEQWKQNRLDTSLVATSFRYSIKLGDMAGANHGIVRFRPPKLMAQVKGLR